MRFYYAILLCLTLICLYLYIGYRTDETLINFLLTSNQNRSYLDQLRSNLITLPSWAIFNLPEGLWVLGLTLLSKGLYVNLNQIKIGCVWIALFFFVGLEFMQFFGVTNGRFDDWDLWFTIAFWLLAVALPLPPKNVASSSIKTRTFLLVISYILIIFSDTITGW